MNKPNPDQEKSASDGKLYHVPVAGSLGLLALGAKGIEIWRKKREAFIEASKNADQKLDSSNEKE